MKLATLVLDDDTEIPIFESNTLRWNDVDGKPREEKMDGVIAMLDDAEEIEFRTLNNVIEYVKRMLRGEK